MRQTIAWILVCVSLLALAGCGAGASGVAGKTYTYEKDGCGGAFTISIHEDGTFTYYEGLLSSHIGMGEWWVSGSVLTLTEELPTYSGPVLIWTEGSGLAPAEELQTSDPTGGTWSTQPYMYRFRVRGEDLAFIGDGSDNFLYVDVRDGELFHGAPTPAAQS